MKSYKKKTSYSKKNQYFVKNILYLILIIVLIKYLSGFMYSRYYSVLPTLRVYPDNKTEIDIIKEDFIEKRTKEDIDFFYLTDESVIYAFKNMVPMSLNSMQNIIFELKVIVVILFLKTIINRPRPIQIDNTLNILVSKSANTAAYPSGHTIQAYYLAKKLSKQFPDKKEELFNMAKKCGYARIYAGLHYPSDNDFGKYIALNIL